jgi:hypothetical protein
MSHGVQVRTFEGPVDPFQVLSPIINITFLASKLMLSAKVQQLAPAPI